MLFGILMGQDGMDTDRLGHVFEPDGRCTDPGQSLVQRRTHSRLRIHLHPQGGVPGRPDTVPADNVTA